jgi:hypothetical protein
MAVMSFEASPNAAWSLGRQFRSIVSDSGCRK